MPLFEYLCEDCDREVELLVSNGEKPTCPVCSSNRLEKLMSVSSGRVNGAALPITNACPPPSAGPCGPACCRLPQ